MRRVFTALLTLTLVAGFVTPRLHGSTEVAPPDSPITYDVSSDVEGRGFMSAIGCVGCIGGGAFIMSNGISAVLTAAAVKGSAIAAATCVALCKDAIDSAW